MNSNHKVNVVRIDEIHSHPNADTLGLVYIGGYQVVVKKDNYKVGDLAVYIQPDSIVPSTEPFKFLWADKEFVGEVPEKYRRITVRRFRKEWSEGLLLPLSDFVSVIGFGPKPHGWEEGDDLASEIGITHYVEPDPTYVLGTPGRKLTLWQKILKFFGLAPKPFGPKNSPGAYDVESLKNYPRLFQEGEEVIATEKIHGSNARYMFDGKTFWVGSHHRWWKDKRNIWWRVAEKYPWIEAFCREWPRATLFGEVTPTQGGYQYGNTPEERFFAFDIKRPDGTWVDKKVLYKFPGIQQLAPIVYQGPYDAKKIKELTEGPSIVEGAKHIREGLVVTSAVERQVRGVGRAQLKIKSMKFFEKESGK